VELTSRDIDEDSRRGAEEAGSSEGLSEDQSPHQGTGFVRTCRDLDQSCYLAAGGPLQYCECGQTGRQVLEREGLLDE
jgi:hypothetical protein